MKTLDISDATSSLASFAQDADTGPIVVTKNGAPVAILMRADDVDLETLAVQNNPSFQKMIARSRAEQRARDTFSEEEVRRMLGID
jgi:PHD/YefM family antitoxin component YafN of YafNO toxin-antitoxin module